MFDALKEQSRYLKLSAYVASATFLSSTGWKREGITDVLVDTNNGDTKTCVAVGEVIDDRLLCGPNGNHTANGRFKKPYGDTKFSFFLGRPDLPGFDEDFDMAQSKAVNMEDKIALTSDHRYWRDETNRNKAFKFAAPTFEQRVRSDLSFCVL